MTARAIFLNADAALEFDRLQDTLMQVQKECLRLQAEVCQLQAQLDYERGWRLKYQEKLESRR